MWSFIELNWIESYRIAPKHIHLITLRLRSVRESVCGALHMNGQVKAFFVFVHAMRDVQWSNRQKTDSLTDLTTSHCTICNEFHFESYSIIYENWTKSIPYPHGFDCFGSIGSYGCCWCGCRGCRQCCGCGCVCRSTSAQYEWGGLECISTSNNTDYGCNREIMLKQEIKKKHFVDAIGLIDLHSCLIRLWHMVSSLDNKINLRPALDPRPIHILPVMNNSHRLSLFISQYL